MKKCIVIGGGVIGLCSAYYLAKAGNQVTVIDKSDMTDGCSYGNAGMIVPSHVVPLAQPGMIAQGFKWMFDSKSPFYVKPRLSRELMSWGWQFYKHSSKAHVNKSMPILHGLSMFSKELYQDLRRDDSFIYEEKGLLMLYKSEKVGEEECHAASLAESIGLKVNYLSKSDVQKMEKNTSSEILGGIQYLSDAHLSPRLFMEFLKKELLKMEVSIKTNVWVEDFKMKDSKIDCLVTNQQELCADEYILCAGSWSPMIAKKAGIKLSILPGKGYSFDVENNSASPTLPSILCEGKVAVTPMGESIRFGGTMEITNTKDHSISLNRVQGIVDTINSFYPELNLTKPSVDKIWHGFRPCTPTGLPIISKANKVSNMIIASGHSMMGLSLAPATGKLVQELVDNKPLSVKVK